MNDKYAMLIRDGEEAAQTDVRTLDRLMESVFGPSPFYGTRRQSAGLGWTPAVDIRETDAELVLYAALPGLSKEDVTLEIKDHALVLSGRMKPLGSDEDSWVRRELARGEFYRAFDLPADVNAAKASASMRDGVLEIRLPKADEARARKVAIG